MHIAPKYRELDPITGLLPIPIPNRRHSWHFPLCVVMCVVVFFVSGMASVERNAHGCLLSEREGIQGFTPLHPWSEEKSINSVDALCIIPTSKETATRSLLLSFPSWLHLNVNMSPYVSGCVLAEALSLTALHYYCISDCDIAVAVRAGHLRLVKGCWSKWRNGLYRKWGEEDRQQAAGHLSKQSTQRWALECWRTCILKHKLPFSRQTQHHTAS